MTVFAYGQTSSGKSYTMGTDRFTDEMNSEPSSPSHGDHVLNSGRTGIVPRAVYTIFNKIQQQTTKLNHITVKTSYVEIYNEDLIDLLASSTTPTSALPQVTIREDKDGTIIWSGLKEVKVTNASDALSLLEQGSQVRQTNSTEMNAQSSRSHAIFSLTLTQSKPSGTSSAGMSNKRVSKIITPSTDEGEWTTFSSKFHFVDLAGSERIKRTAAVAERVKEGISINAGLHALGNVISALGDPSKSKTVIHIPYRDSKLTRLLQDSLGGNAQTLMVACVSPSEHNLNETLNTLKYANRARNIKNRAQVNAQEVGWEDVEYLQSTIIKLRKELATLKNSNAAADLSSNRMLSSINEEDTAHDELSPKYLDLKGHYTELQAKYAKTLSDLAQAQNNMQIASRNSGQPATISQSAFDDMIQPIVEEYEKSITALESQLALTKAALVHSEYSMKELEDQLSNEQTLNESQANYLADLKARLNRLSERESENESYIKDLELKLKTLSESEESSAEMVIELKKELAKIKEHDLESEAYIKDLEARLFKDDSGNLNSQVAALEASLAERDERYDALDAKYQSLSSQLTGSNAHLWHQQQHLTEQLSEREGKLEKLEVMLVQLENEKNELECERQKLEATTEETSRTNNELLGRLKALESSTQRSSSVATDRGDARSIRSTTHLSPRRHNFTPPATPAANYEVADSSEKNHVKGDLFAELNDLRERYESTALELDQVRAKYNNSVKELEDLTVQLEESRVVQSSSWISRRSITSSNNLFRNSGSNFGSPSPSPVLQSPSWSLPNSNSLSNHGVLPVRGFGTPVTAGRSFKYSEGQASRTKQGDSLEELADSDPHESGEGFPTDSIMSRDPSAPRSITINTSQLRVSLNSASLLPHGRSMSLSLSHDASSPQSSARRSIIRASSDSRSESVSRLAEQGAPHSGERSYESLQKEVIKLQEVLKDREDEIRSLEVSIRAIRRMSDSITPPVAPNSADHIDDKPHNQDQSIGKAEPSIHLSNESTHQTDGTVSTSNDVVQSKGEDSIDPDSVAQSDEVLAALQSQISLNDGDEAVVKDSQNIKLLDNLMRSMAQKESAHLELIENLKDKLQSTKRQHDELVKLSRDQVVNMSSEIEALRQKLSHPPTPAPDLEMSSRLSKLEKLLLLKEQESDSLKAESARQLVDLEVKLLEAKQLEIQALKAEHDSVVEQLKLEQRDNLNRLIALSEENLMAKQDELRQLEDRWQNQSKADLVAQAEKIRAEFEQERKELVESRSQAQALATEEQQSRFDKETQQLLDQHAQSFEHLHDEHNQKLKHAEVEYQAKLQELQSSHSSEVTRLKTSLSSRGQQGATTTMTLIESHQEELEALQSSLGNQLQEQKSQFEAEKSELISQHEVQIKSIEARHEARIMELKAEHEEILVASLTELDLRRTRKFESNLSALQEKHQAEINEIKQHHQKQIEPTGNSPDLKTVTAPGSKSGIQQDDDSVVTGSSDLENIKASYEEKIEMLQLQHQTELHALEEKFLMSSLSSDLQEERQANQRKIDLLTDELDYLKEEVQKHKAGDPSREAAQSEAELELQEALDTLSTLDKALLESQAEREELMKQLNEMKRFNSTDQETMAKELASLQAEFERVKQERDELMQLKDSTAEINSRSGHGMGSRSDSPSLPGLPTRSHLLANGKPPPPTPPPNMPPPPPPTSSVTNPNLPGLTGTTTTTSSIATTIRRPARTSNSSSQLSHTNNSMSGRESPSTSVATSCLVDSSMVDPRMVKKIEEQEIAIARLSKQLSQCETDLKGNIDLVTNLESALNETERNLRKSRLQMNELAKERDKISTQNESLRKELAAATAEVEHVRNNVQAEKAQFENQLGEERRAKENAKKQLEARLEEMQASRMTRKSKFNCF